MWFSAFGWVLADPLHVDGRVQPHQATFTKPRSPRHCHPRAAADAALREAGADTRIEHDIIRDAQQRSRKWR